MKFPGACTAVLALACVGAPTLACGAEPETEQEDEAAGEQGDARAYLGLGLVAARSTLSQATMVGDINSEGGGLGVNGAGHSQPVKPWLDIAFSGQVAVTSREFDDGSEVADMVYEVDGGVRFSRQLMVTLGYTTQVTAYDNPDVAITYNVIPVGVGFMHTHERGYLLAQLRAGRGRISNDQTDDTESVGYFGMRGVVQHGFGSGVQLMLAIGLDRYKLHDPADTEEEFFRLEFGLGFGI